MRAKLAVLAIAMIAAIGLTSIGSTASAVEQTTPEPAQDAPKLTTETFRVGPFKLAAKGQPGSQVNRIYERMPRPKGDIAITDVTYRFVNKAGNDISPSRAHLHHLVLVDQARPDQLCSDSYGSRFAGTGMELTDLHLPAPYAFMSPAGSWGGVYHVMNMSDTSVTASIEYSITYGDPADFDFLDVEPYFLDVTGCWSNSASEYNVPGGGGPDSVHEKSKSYELRRDSRLVAGIGHVHAGGIEVELDGPDGQLCKSEAVYHDTGMHDAHHGSLAAVTPCGAMGQELEVGDKLTLTSRYMNEHPTAGAMGILELYVHHTDPPPPEPTIEVTVDGANRTSLFGTVVCNRPMQGWLDVQLHQKAPRADIEGWGSIETEMECSTEPTPFSIRIQDANGVFRRGEVDYMLYAYVSEGGDFAQDQVSGTLTLNRWINLARSTPPDSGTIPITIDPQSTKTKAGQAITGTIECATAQNVYIWLGGIQQAGRYFTDLGGQANVECDGLTDFSLDVWSYRRPFMAKQTRLTLNVYGEGSFDEGSTKSASVLLSDDFEIERDPKSDVQIDRVRLEGRSLKIDLTMRACPAGRELFSYVRVAVPSTKRPGHPSRDFKDSSIEGKCTGKRISLTHSIRYVGSADRVAVWAIMDNFDEVTDEFGFEINQGFYRIRR